jgi:hypothetical protein
MWLWIKHWLDWVTTEVIPLSRTRPHGQAIHTRYEKAGLALYDLPVPWSADAVVVEVNLRLPAAARRKGDFLLRLPGREPVAPEALRPEAGDRHRLVFRFPVPPASTTGELLWKHHLLARVAVPVLTAEAFVAGLRVTLPTVSVRLGDQTVSAQTFVAAQCKGVIASAILKSPTPLAPVADLGLRIVFRSERSAAAHETPVAMSSSQLAAREAVVTAALPKHPRRGGSWVVSWRLGNREVTAQRIQGIGTKRFEQSLRVSDTRFIVADKAGAVKLTKQPPTVGELVRLGPCFLVASSEAGMAGVCRVSVHAVISGETQLPMLMEQDVLVTDGPTVFAPGMIDATDLLRVSGFELRHKGRVLGVASLSPVPTATLNAEGGFKSATDFAWSTAAEDELTERLARLMNGGN